jgi:hypothetical protein
MRVAMLSYNTFVTDKPNGWYTNGDNAVLLIQYRRGETWGADSLSRSVNQLTAETETKVDALWRQLEQEINSLDGLVIYLGSYGAERALEQASAHGVSADRLLLVSCSCNQPVKRDWLERYGYTDARIVAAICGGHSEMLAIYDRVLAQGALPAA